MGLKYFTFIGDVSNWFVDKTTIEIMYFEKEINQFLLENNIKDYELMETERSFNDGKCKVVQQLIW